MTNTIALSFIALQLVCGQPGGWKFSHNLVELENGVEELTIELNNDTVSAPPEFTVKWKMPQRDIPHLWHVAMGHGGIAPDWASWRESTSWLCSRAPVYAFYSDENENRLVTAADDAKREVSYSAGFIEHTAEIDCRWRFFFKKSPSSKYERVRIRFDRRKKFWSDAVQDAFTWITSLPGNATMPVPAAAYKPLYSAWYTFHRDVFADQIEAECVEAAKLGMKTLIVDDGWQMQDALVGSSGYDYCGDWEMSLKRFPNMKEHVKRVQSLGMKYMLWYSVPYVGIRSKAAQKFKGKFLREPRLKSGGGHSAGVLDPRFPEVREYLAGIYEKAMLEWGLDGLKLDFIDSFSGGIEARPGDGRDIASVAEAVDVLMTDVSKRLQAIKSDVLIEFRQSYIGPFIRKFGNMLRVADCPGDMTVNRSGVASLRLSSGNTAVHADMLEWHFSDTAENAARFILNTIFGTVQYSVMLRKLPESHREMVRHWIEFSVAHEEALRHGSFKAYWPHLGWPYLVGESAKERIIGVYASGLVAEAGSADRDVYILNATQAQTLTVRLSKASTVQVVDTFGKAFGEAIKLPAGLNDIKCPPSGYIKISK